MFQGSHAVGRCIRKFEFQERKVNCSGFIKWISARNITTLLRAVYTILEWARRGRKHRLPAIILGCNLHATIVTTFGVACAEKRLSGDVVQGQTDGSP